MTSGDCSATGTRCLECGSSNALPILYGLPTEKAVEESAAGRISLGGCVKLLERLAEARIGRERTVIGHQVEATVRQIDRLVYELYGLTEEIRIVEEATSQ